MGVPSGTYKTYEIIGEAEDIADVIYDVSPIDTPFLSSIDAVDAHNILHQWQTDALATAVANNFVLEGRDAVTNTATATTLLSNTCSIADKVARVSGTGQATAKYGRGDELELGISSLAA